MPSILLIKERGYQKKQKNAFPAVKGLITLLGLKSFTQMEHLQKKIETYKSNIGAKWCCTYCKGQRY